MAKRISLGPVFESEWLAVSRRWQWWAARSILVLAVLFALALVWFGRTSRNPARTVQAQAEIGRLLCGAITATQLAIVLLVAPAATAGAICLDRARGTLAYMLVTDLSSTEILLATPLSTRSIVWGKWWGTFRAVPLLAVAPGAVAATLAHESGRWEGAALIVGLFIAYGAAVTSLGLGLSTWMHRLDHAVAANVAVLGGVTVG